MTSQISTGSPKMNRRQTPSAPRFDNANDDGQTPRNVMKASFSKSATPVPKQREHSVRLPMKDPEHASPEPVHQVNDILAQLRINDNRKLNFTQGKQHDHLDKVMANLKDQKKTLKKQQVELKDDSDAASYKDQDRSSGSDLFTPATESFDTEVHDSIERKPPMKSVDITRIRQELEAAKTLINRQEMELAESRNLRHTMEQAMGPASESDFPLQSEAVHMTNVQNQSAFNASARPFTSHNEPSWSMVDDGKADLAATLVNSGIGRGRTWGQAQQGLNSVAGGYQNHQFAIGRDGRANSLGYGTSYLPQTSPIQANFPQHRTFSSGSSNISYGIEDRMYNNVTHAGTRRPINQMRTNSTMSDPLSPITPISFAQTLVDPGAYTNMNGQLGYGDRAFNGQTSPVLNHFPAGTGQILAGDLPFANNGLNAQNYVMPAEPMNYRRLLDKSVSCDWKYIVDKIVCNNDQQASIFLQQKLKVGTAEQKYEIVESIVNQAYPLMINRFGNFLVQRCFEHGTPDQVIAIANAIHGNVISLSMDPFGCHVIQKAFDSVPEDHKADMVRELLRRIPDTVIHRYACHVWQKLFELRWSSEPPQIMVKVNEALQGMWHEVALGETGSLVVQNIFENCVEEEKRPAIEEVIANIDLIAHGQFGNWCIQHLCEHGSPPDKRRVIDHILQNSYNYSIDQFASKVVEKCLKIGGPEFLERYLGVITTARPDRPRIPLIDIAGDQYGNYLIQWILMNTHQHQREQVGIHIRKHMVSLRGSKFGSRVAMLCSNPAAATRPGTASALVNPYVPPPQQRMGGRYR